MTVENDDDVYGYGLGMLFEGEHLTTLKHFEWTLIKCHPDDGVVTVKKCDNDCFESTNLSSAKTNATAPGGIASELPATIRVAVHCIDDEPGAVQSGHYIWPAGPALVDYLVSSWPTSKQPRSVLELGAGTALVSLATIQLYECLWPHEPTVHSQQQQQQQQSRAQLPFFVVSDHDPTVLKRARENYETTMVQSPSLSSSFKQQPHHGSSITATKEGSHTYYDTTIGWHVSNHHNVFFHPLSWGDKGDIQKLQNVLSDFYSSIHPTMTTTDNHHEYSENTKPMTMTTTVSVTFDLLLGSDLIYCLDVVEPLFRTVAALMTRETSISEEGRADLHKYDDDDEVVLVGYTNDTCHRTGRFLLAQSFGFDQEIDKEIDRQCDQHQWDRIVLVDTLSKCDQGIKIQEFVPIDINNNSNKSCFEG